MTSDKAFKERDKMLMSGDSELVEKSQSTILNRRIEKAYSELESMIDGGEECRGKDSQISYIMQILMGEI